MPCRTRVTRCAALAALIVTSAAAPAYAVDTFPNPQDWPAFTAVRIDSEQIGPGVSYERWALSPVPTSTAGPLAVSIATVDVTNPFVELVAAAQHSAVQGPGERLSAIADKIHAEAGVNADYFDISETGAPTNALIVDGRTLHQPNGAAVFFAGADRRPHFGVMTWRAIVTPTIGASLAISNLNDWSASTPLTLLTPELGNTLAYGATEAVLHPAAGSGGFVVTSMYQKLDKLTPLAPGEIGVAAHGAAAATIAVTLVPGRAATVAYEGDPDPASIATAIGGGPLLLRGGVPYADPAAPAPQETEVRYPLTGAGLSADGRTLTLIVVDGRRPGVSVGITRPMFGSLFLALGASDAMAFDSGGSSEMVVRRLGDPNVAVATMPSDGRERAIADGLFIRNTAPVGPAAQLLLRPAEQVVLAGSRLSLHVEAIDANMQPVALPPEAVTWSVDPAGVLAIEGAGNIVARLPGDARVIAGSGAISVASTVSIVTSIAGVTIVGFGPVVQPGSTVQLEARAIDARGRPVVLDASAVTWSAGEGAAITAGGALTAGTAPAAISVHAAAGGAATSALVNVGEHAVPLQHNIPAGVEANAWRFSASSKSAGGALDESPAPDGSAAARLTFDLPAGSGTRAAYAVNTLAVAGAPTGISCDVYGDGLGEWLRASYRNADGIEDSVTLARRVDWIGWRTLRVAVLPQVRWPITLTRVYVVQPAADAVRGAIWLRELTALYPGP